jgi:hypothetical protein
VFKPKHDTPVVVPVASESEDGCDVMYRMRKDRVAGGSSNKSRNNRRK